MAQDIFKAFGSNLISPLALLGDFIKSPRNFHNLHGKADFLKKSAALYILSGVLLLFSIKSQMDELRNVTGYEPASNNLGLVDVPILGDLLIVIYGMIFVFAFTPSAYFLASSKQTERTGSDYVALIFALGSIGAFIVAVPSMLGTLTLHAENADELLEYTMIRSFMGFIPVLVFIPFFAINVKRFSSDVSWGRLFMAFLISMPFTVIITAVLNVILY